MPLIRAADRIDFVGAAGCGRARDADDDRAQHRWPDRNRTLAKDFERLIDGITAMAGLAIIRRPASL